MIRIERSAMPAGLDRQLADGRAAAAAFFASKAGQSGYKRFDFGDYVAVAKDALDALFHRKCAFCESVAPGARCGHFRPAQNCVDEKGRHFPRHYSWLITAWPNLYLACPECLAARNNRFPIAGERASLDAGPGELDSERPLLLDPCRDNPEEHLVYADDARVTSNTDRGRVTIELFDLNRPALVDARRRRLQQLEEVLQVIGTPDRRDPIDRRLRDQVRNRTGEFVRDEDKYAGMCRQFVGRFFAELYAEDDDPRRGLAAADGDDELLGTRKGYGLPAQAPGEQADDELLSTRRGSFSPPADDRKISLEDLSATLGEGDRLPRILAGLRQSMRSTRYVSKAEQAATSRAFEQYEEALESFSLEAGDTGEAESYYLQSRTIERVELYNFRAIGDLRLELPRHRGAWTMLLGENGCGKSSVLQAVALALMGKSYRSRLDLDARDFVRRGQDEGMAKIKLSGLSREIVLRFGTGSRDFHGAGEAKVLLLAYGSTRLLPREPAAPTGTRYARVDNLFDPFTPLEDARRWLLALEAATFDRLKPSLKELLNLGEDDDLVQNRESNRVDVTLFDSTVPLEQLSDGYQTVIALVAEIMSVLLDRWQDMAAAEGIVLVDEIGAHLHPKWKMQIVRSLRTAFPAVQFLTTTHDPLCLRGLEDGEVVVMRRNADNEVVQVQDLPPVKALRVDQLLTSEHFGLSSVHDPESARLFEEYYALLAQEGMARDDPRLRELRDRLDGLSLMGQTRRERLMLEAIDKHLAREAEAVGSKKAAGHKQTLDLKLQRILAPSDFDPE